MRNNVDVESDNTNQYPNYTFKNRKANISMVSENCVSAITVTQKKLISASTGYSSFNQMILELGVPRP